MSDEERPLPDVNPVSVRLPGDLVVALRQLARGNGETMSDALRRGALLVLGICPTCGQPAPSRESDLRVQP